MKVLQIYTAGMIMTDPVLTFMIVFVITVQTFVFFKC